MPPKIIGVIPAHLESVRLPRKPLLPICGHPMIAWVYARARLAPELSELLVATDSDEIYEWCRSVRIPAMMTSAAHRSGTDRILEVLARQSKEGCAGDVYVNVQGDEPLVDPEHIRLMLQPFSEAAETQVATLKIALDPAEAADPNKVKVVTDSSGAALYFSRSPIPYDRNQPSTAAYYKHIGLYAYSASALEKFRRFPTGPLEQAEKLEQLRFLENNIPIIVRETTKETIGIDTPEDLRRAEEYFERRRIHFPEI